MGSIKLTQFAGKMPRINNRLLEQRFATTALNTDFTDGTLSPAHVSAVSASLDQASTLRTAYKMDSGTHKTFTGYVSVVKGFVSDGSGRIFYTGDGYPKQTTNAGDIRRLGMYAPRAALTISLSGTPTDTILRTTSYCYTYVSAAGEESAPCAPTAVVDVYEGQTVTLSGFTLVGVPAGQIVSAYRLYRILGSVYVFVKEIGTSGTYTVDNVADADTGEELATATWLPPVDSLAGLIQASNGVLAGFSGRELYLSEPFIPYAFPIEYMQKTNYDIVAIGHFGSSIAVLTTDYPYIATATDPASCTLQMLPYQQRCMSAHGVVNTGSGLIYPSPDGLFYITESGGQILTEQAIDREKWQESYDISNILAFYAENQYIAFFKGTKTGFVFDLSTGSISDITVDAVDYIYNGYVDSTADALKLLAVKNGVYAVYTYASIADGFQNYTWVSKVFAYDSPVSMCAVRVSAEFSAVPLAIKIYCDGTVAATISISTDAVYRFANKRGKNWQIEISGAAKVFSVALGSSVQDVVNGG